MLKNVLTTLALALTVLPAAAKLPVIAEGSPCAMAQETVCAETVVTENGAPEEKALLVLTPSDFPAINRCLEAYSAKTF